jgi:hypothetical protein
VRARYRGAVISAHPRPGRVATVLRAAIELLRRSIEAVDNGQFGFGIADTQNSTHTSIADDCPVHITSRTVDADVMQGGEPLAPEKVYGA